MKPHQHAALAIAWAFTALGFFFLILAFDPWSPWPWPGMLCGLLGGMSLQECVDHYRQLRRPPE